MEYILRITETGYEQIPVQGEEKEHEANRWTEAEDGKQVLYISDSVHRYEHQGKIAIMKKGRGYKCSESELYCIRGRRKAGGVRKRS